MEAFWVVWDPIVDGVFNVTDAVDIAENFEVLDVPWVVELLDLLVAVVLEEVHHVFVHAHDLGVLPGGGRHVHEAVQVVNAEADVDAVLGRQLDLVLAVPGQRVRQVDPGRAGLLHRLDEVEAVRVVVQEVAPLVVVLLTASRAEDHRVLPRREVVVDFVAVVVQVLVLVDDLELDGPAVVGLDDVRVLLDLDLEKAVDPDALLVPELGGRDDQLRVDQIEVVGVRFLELPLHGLTHVVEQRLDSREPVSGKVLELHAAYHAHVLDEQQEDVVGQKDISELALDRRKQVVLLEFFALARLGPRFHAVLGHLCQLGHLHGQGLEFGVAGLFVRAQRRHYCLVISGLVSFDDRLHHF